MPLPADLPTQLPRTAAPSHYTIAVVPDMEALTFTGRSAVDLTVFEATNTIVLNARDLKIGAATLASADGTTTLPVTVSQDAAAQTASFHSDAVIARGNYRLSTDYTGTINTQANGLFALDYPDKRDGSPRPPAMLSAFKGEFTRWAPIDQLGLLRDQLALSTADYQPYGPSLDLVRAVPGDGNAIVVGRASGTYEGFYETLKSDPAAQAKIAAIASAQFGPRLAALGYAPRAGEEMLDENLRSLLISDLGTMGDKRVLAEASRLFSLLQSDPKALDGPLKTTWMSLIARNATPAQWNQLLALARGSTSAVEKTTYYSLLGAAQDKALARKALDLALTKEPGATTSAGMIGSVAGDNPDLAFDFYLANEAKIAALIDDSARARLVSRLAGGSQDPAMIGKLERFAARQSEDEARPIRQTIGFMKQAAITRPRAISEVKAWLATR